MKKLWIPIATATLIATTAAVTARVTTQDPGGDRPEWLKYTERTEGHEKMDGMVGRWQENVRFWPEPGAQPEEASVEADFRWIYGGRYILGKVNGYVMGDPVEVTRLMGYDAYRGEYFAFLIDNWSTSYQLVRGKWDDAKSALVLTGTRDDIEKGQKDTPFRWEIRYPGPDKKIAEMYIQLENGRMHRAVEITSTRLE